MTFQATYIDVGADLKPVTEVALQHNTGDYIPFGADNLFPQALALYNRTSPNHRGIINSKKLYIMGDGIMSGDAATDEMLNVVNYEGDSITAVIGRLCMDDLSFGNGWLEIITDRNGSFCWFNQLDATKCRLSKDRKMCILHPDWRTYKGKADKWRRELPLFPNFAKDTEDENNAFPAYRSVLHIKDYEPEFVYYGLPDYIAAKDSIKIDLKTNKWNLARLENSFKVSGILVIPVADAAESKQVIDRIKRDHIGEGNQGKLLTITKSRATVNEKADQTQLIESKTGDESGNWTKLHEQSVNDMVVAHRWFRSLTGLADNTGFDTQRILNEYEVAKNTTIAMYQKKYIKMLQKVYKHVQGLDVELQFMNKAPYNSDEYKYVWELREEKGLDIDKSDPQQQQIVSVHTKPQSNG